MGYARNEAGNGDFVLPEIREGVLSPVDVLKDKSVNDATRARLNLFYAKEYSVYNDFWIAARGIRYLGAER